MPGERSRELWTNREVILASDLTRVGKLANMETQNAEEMRATRADFYDPATNSGNDFLASVKALAGPAPGLIRAPSIDPVAGTFNVTLGAGEGEVVGAGTIPADESEYQLCRWAGQALTWPTEGLPNPTNPRICLIVATPSDVTDELQSRNILVNPDTRETTPANVYKLSRPTATITVLPGDANVAPVPPSCPAGSLPLFEVIVPAGATDSTLYHFVRRSWRRIEFPGTSQHGIVKNCVPDLTESTTSVNLGLPSLGANGETLVHRLVIDGELLTWSTTNHLPIVPDIYAPPTTAPADSDRPVYLYLCGGSHSPLRYQGRSSATPSGTWAPVVLVESLTPPDPMGYPRGALQFQWGAVALEVSRAAACYIGIRWLIANSTNNAPVVYDGDIAKFMSVLGATSIGLTTDSTSGLVSFTLPGLPVVSTVMRIRARITGTASTAFYISRSSSTSDEILECPEDSINYECDAKAQSTLYHKNLTPSDTVHVRIRAVNMNIPRLSR
jgi:hypothetical protein